MWVVFAIAAAFSFALVHVLDSYCVGEVFEKPWTGVVTSSIASIVVFQLIPIVGPFVDLQLPHYSIVLLAFSSGVLIQVSQAFYFQSLAYSDAGIVASYWNVIPAILPLAGFFLFNRILTIFQILGITLLIFSSILMCIADSNMQARWRSLGLMFFAAILQVASYLIQDFVFEKSHFFIAFLIITSGLIFTGLVPLFFKKIRLQLKKQSNLLVSLLKFFVLIEVVNLFALFFAQNAIARGDPSLVAAVETTMPAHAFLLSGSLYFINKKYFDGRVVKNFYYKISLVALMVFGVWMVS